MLPNAYRLPHTAHRSPLTLQARHPDTPFIMYIAKSAALLERMAATGEHNHSRYIQSQFSHSKFSHRCTQHYPERPLTIAYLLT